MLRRAWLAFLLLLLPSLAYAQGAIQASGSFTPGHALRSLSVTGKVAGDAGGAAGSSIAGVGYLTEIGVTNTGTPICINDNLINAPGGYHQLCFGANSAGGGLISYNAIAGATPQNLVLNLNGVPFTFPFAISGIAGPGSSTINDLACWNNGTGTLLKDCGPISARTKNSALYVSPSGNDSNSGLSPAQALQHIQAAVNLFQSNMDCSGASPLINVAAGTYAEAVTIENRTSPGCNAFLFIAGAGVGSTIIQPKGAGACFDIGVWAGLVESGLTCDGTSIAGPGYRIHQHGDLETGANNIGTSVTGNFGSFPVYECADDGHVNFTGALGVAIDLSAGGPGTGGATALVYAHGAGCHVQANSSNFAFSNIPNWTTGTILTGAGAVVDFSGATFTGTCTGRRYNVAAGSSLLVANSASTHLCGDNTAVIAPTGSVVDRFVQAGAILNGFPSNPAGTTSTGSFKMMGIGGTCTITPNYSTRVQISISGYLTNTNATAAAEAQLVYGTGAAPSNGAAATGTAVGGTPAYTASGNGTFGPFAISGYATGLTVGTPIWIDLSMLAITAGTASAANLGCSAAEM